VLRPGLSSPWASALTPSCITHRVSHCVSLTVSRTASPSLCLPLCLSHRLSHRPSLPVSPSPCLSHRLSHCVSLTVSLTASPSPSPSPCLPHRLPHRASHCPSLTLIVWVPLHSARARPPGAAHGRGGVRGSRRHGLTAPRDHAAGSRTAPHVVPHRTHRPARRGSGHGPLAAPLGLLPARSAYT
jgi:hypothetical protein